MPSSITVAGVQQLTPGIYAQVDASALGGGGVTTGRVAVVGDFPWLPANTPTAFTSARALSDASGGDAAMALLGRLAFSPSTDGRVAAGVRVLVLVNAGTSAQAARTFADAGGVAALSVKAARWGSRGNRTHVALVANGTALDVTVRANGTEEVYSGIESGPIFSIQYTGGLLTDAVAAFDPSDKYKIAWEIAEICAGDWVDHEFGAAALPHARCAAAGTTIVAEINQNVGNPMVVVVTGVPPSGVGTVTETLTIAAGSQTAIGVTLFAEITKIETTSIAGATLTVTGHAFALVPGSFTTIKSVLDLIASAPGFVVVEKHPRVGSIPAGEIDKTAATSILAAINYRADLYELVRRLGASTLINVERDPAAVKPPVAASQFLIGGSQVAAVAGGYSSALDALLTEDVQIVVPLSTDAAVAVTTVSHANNAALYGSERQIWIGAAAGKTLAEILADYTVPINSRHVAIVGQQIRVFAPDGTSPLLDPPYLAVTLAAMQAGTAVGTPLTGKRPAVTEVIGAWNGTTDANGAIDNGICSLGYSNLGWSVTRSVTTYLTDANPIWSEVSAVESVNTCVRSLRARLRGQIGDPVTSATAAQILSATETALAQQIRDGIIKGFQNVTVVDGGDRFDISFEVAATEPLNFIVINASVVRIASSV